MTEPIAATRDRLLLAAMQLFWEKGYGSTSVADVLAAAKVNSGSLYHYFPGKQDLLLAVLDAYRKGIEPMLLAPAWQGIDDPVARIFALLARYRASIVQTDCTYGCPIGSLALEIHEPDPPVRQAMADNFHAWVDAIEGCLAAAGARLPKSTKRRELAEFVLTTMEGGVMQARTHRDVAFFDGAVRQLRSYFDYLEREALDGQSQPKAAGKPASTRKRRTAAKPRTK
ncbi:MAG TPA: TetR/AcrR family transcriptional regulator [Xanthomonadaceae bacterium]|jgi:TetR/AcrR family transcriptional repressor of nem operon|nr:TetR/AcrR family transcriptional regulator [Xanthomonadaceae bacterium]